MQLGYPKDCNAAHILLIVLFLNFIQRKESPSIFTISALCRTSKSFHLNLGRVFLNLSFGNTLSLTLL